MFTAQIRDTLVKLQVYSVTNVQEFVVGTLILRHFI